MGKKWYKLDEFGKVVAEYALFQPTIEGLVELDERPDISYLWNGEEWEYYVFTYTPVNDPYLDAIDNFIESSSGWVRTRARKQFGDLKGKFIYFTTGDDQSLDSGGDSDYSITVTSTGTYIDYYPNFNYEISGGSVVVHESSGYMIDKELKISFILAPDIPVEYGGSWPFISNKKLNQFCLSYERNVDPKYLRYRDG